MFSPQMLSCQAAQRLKGLCIIRRCSRHGALFLFYILDSGIHGKHLMSSDLKDLIEKSSRSTAA